jgi:nucleoside diphosphate kinase
MVTQEFALVLIKPDATERGLEEEILSGLERKGLRVVKYGTIMFDERMVLKFYEWVKLDHPEEINAYICTTPLPVWIVSGNGAISKTMEYKMFLRTQYCNGPLKNLFHSPVSQEESCKQFELIGSKSKK